MTFVRRLTRIRRNALVRTSALIVVDNALLAGAGAICTVLATRLWPASAVGAVAAVIGPLNLVLLGSSLGLSTTIVRFLGSERRQTELYMQGLSVTIPTACAAAATIVLVPHHFGLPLDRIGLNQGAALALTLGYVALGMLQMLGDGAWIARQEVSWMIGKDGFAISLRLGLLLAVGGGGASRLFVITAIYVATAGWVDAVLLAKRLNRAPRPPHARRLDLLRERSTFAISAHLVTVVASVPFYTLPPLAAGFIGIRSSAYVAVTLQVAALLTTLPTATSASLLSELGRPDRDVVEVTIKAMRVTYGSTLVCAALLIAVAPEVLGIFGRQYALHGTAFLRWFAAGSVFFVFNYVSDATLLARGKKAAFVAVNWLGTAVIMVLVIVALQLGFAWLGPAWLLGQLVYMLISVVAIARYTGWGGLRAGLMQGMQLRSVRVTPAGMEPQVDVVQPVTREAPASPSASPEPLSRRARSRTALPSSPDAPDASADDPTHQ